MSHPAPRIPYDLATLPGESPEHGRKLSIDHDHGPLSFVPHCERFCAISCLHDKNRESSAIRFLRAKAIGKSSGDFRPMLGVRANGFKRMPLAPLVLGW